MTQYEDVCRQCTERQHDTVQAAITLWTRHAQHTRDVETRDLRLEQVHDARAGVWHVLRPHAERGH